MNDWSSKTLRPVGGGDREFLKKVFDSSWQRAFAASGLPAEAQGALLAHQFEAQDRSYRTRAPDAEYSIIVIDDEPAGRIYIDRRDDEIGLMEMTLLPGFRNRKIGTSLIRDLLAEAQRCRKPVVLYVEHWNPDARRLYLRLGFEDQENIGTHWKMVWTPG